MDITPEYITEDNMDGLDAEKMQSDNSMYDRYNAAAYVVKETIKLTNENMDLPSNHE